MSIRQQHYKFSHDVLPSRYHATGYAMLAKLAGTESEMYLFTLWRQLGGLSHLGPGKYPGSDSTEMIKLRVVATMAMASDMVTFIGMPPVEAAGESYYAAIVHGSANGSLETHYYVWDRAAAEGKANLASYNAKSMRIALGVRDDVSLEGFAAAVAEDRGGVATPLDMNEDDGQAQHDAIMARARSAGRSGAPSSKGGLLKAVAALAVLGVGAFALALGWLEFGGGDDKPYFPVETKTIKSGKKFTVKVPPPIVGTSRDTVWLKTDGSKSVDFKFSLGGKFGCTKKKKKRAKLKSVGVSRHNRKDTHDVSDVTGSIQGWFRLGTFKRRAGDRPLKCRGILKGDPGKLKKAKIVVTRHQKPSGLL